MKIEVDTDFAIPVSVAILAIILVFMYQTLVPRSYIDELILHEQEAFQDASDSARQVDILTHQLEEYHTTEEALISLGASHTQAVAVIKSAEVYNLDPKF